MNGINDRHGAEAMVRRPWDETVSKLPNYRESWHCDRRGGVYPRPSNWFVNNGQG